MPKNTLIVFYSWSGNTRIIAEKIQAINNGDVLEIVPLNPYPQNYSEATTAAKKEIREGIRPKLQSYNIDISNYDIIFAGTPNWWSTMAPPVAAFLSENNFSGKQIIPFCTHGGGGQGSIVSDIIKLCPGSAVTECLTFSASQLDTDNDALEKKINSLGI